MCKKTNDYEKREKLARIARHEALKEYQANEFKGGDQIEKYLSDFRKAFIKLDNKEQDWNNTEIGFDWCGAFVCWCAKQAGFELPIIKPIPIGGSLASVPVWYHFAKSPQHGFYYSESDANFQPEPGDLVLFNHVFSGKDLDHIGVVLEVFNDYLITGEGNEENRTKQVKRIRDSHINGYIRLRNL